ncbi:MAG: DUF1289 domain-containing protein [Hylemonella sp.]|jgi:predicted Fe-S protein YdhL (DUF1289 family)|uniref:DUF1289 domain-containing protein n=1 Tax=Hylemonella sp. TaxID=2066020 RepID=UPI00391CE0CD
MEWLARQAERAQRKVSDLPSPCIAVCRMEMATGLCQGCRRTLEEIRAWSTLDDGGKRAVWALIEQRALQAEAAAQGDRP